MVRIGSTLIAVILCERKSSSWCREEIYRYSPDMSTRHKRQIKCSMTVVLCSLSDNPLEIIQIQDLSFQWDLPARQAYPHVIAHFYDHCECTCTVTLRVEICAVHMLKTPLFCLLQNHTLGGKGRKRRRG